MRRTYIIWTVALCMAICISIFSYSTEEIQAATGSFTIPESTSTPTPSPTPSPTPTVSPTPTLTPTPIPEPTMKLTVDTIGNVTEWLRNGEGTLLEDVISSSRDGNIILKISKGTIVLDSEAKALTHIVITAIDPSITTPPLAPPDSFFFVNTYQFSPDGVNLSKPADIVISYNPPKSFLSRNPITLRMYSFNNTSYEWKEIPILLNFDANTVSFSIDHFSLYALAATLLPSPTPASAPDHSSLILLILILPVASLTFFIYVLIRWRRSNSADENDNS